MAGTATMVRSCDGMPSVRPASAMARRDCRRQHGIQQRHCQVADRNQAINAISHQVPACAIAAGIGDEGEHAEDRHQRDRRDTRSPGARRRSAPPLAVAGVPGSFLEPETSARNSITDVMTAALTGRLLRLAARPIACCADELRRFDPRDSARRSAGSDRGSRNPSPHTRRKDPP